MGPPTRTALVATLVAWLPACRAAGGDDASYWERTEDPGGGRLVAKPTEDAAPPPPPDETVTLSFTTVSYGGKYAPKHVEAVWVEDGGGEFVRTLEVHAFRRSKHLTEWYARAGAVRIDAVTGASLRQHGSHDVVWDYLDTDRRLVPDGGYRFVMEFTEDNSAKPGKPPSRWFEVPFDKAPDAMDFTVPDGDYFTDVAVTYQRDSGGTPGDGGATP